MKNNLGYYRVPEQVASPRYSPDVPFMPEYDTDRVILTTDTSNPITVSTVQPKASWLLVPAGIIALIASIRG